MLVIVYSNRMCCFQLGEATVAKDIEIPGFSLVEETNSRCGEMVPNVYFVMLVIVYSNRMCCFQLREATVVKDIEIPGF